MKIKNLSLLLILILAFSTAFAIPAYAVSGWGTAELVEKDNSETARNPQIAVDGSGNAIAVWKELYGGYWWIKANRYEAGVGWGTPLTIGNTGNALEPQVAMDGSGNAIAVWRQNEYDGAGWHIKANRYDAAIGWGAPVPVEINTGSALSPRIAMDGSGNAIAVWRQDDGSYYSIWANKYTSGGWGTPELIETNDTGKAVAPQIAMDGSGNAVVVWGQFDDTPSRYSIWTNRYNGSKGTWGNAVAIESDTRDAYGPQVAMDGSGNAVVVWLQADGDRLNIWANKYYSGGWGTAQLIETNNTGEAWQPQVAMNVNGNIFAVWPQSDGARLSIWAIRSTISTAWGTPGLIETNDSVDVWNVQVGIDGSGNAIAVWEQYDYAAKCFSIWANRYKAGVGWGTPELIETYDTGYARGARIAVEGGGDAVVVWHQYDGDRFNIWSNRYYNTTVIDTVRIAGVTPVYYSTLQEAYDAAVDGDIIQSQAVSFIENLAINLNKSVTFEGGYDSNFASIIGKTTINGTMTISNGNATIEDFIVD